MAWVEGYYLQIVQRKSLRLSLDLLSPGYSLGFGGSRFKVFYTILRLVRYGCEGSLRSELDISDLLGNSRIE
jgi:hypothetical protein